MLHDDAALIPALSCGVKARSSDAQRKGAMNRFSIGARAGVSAG